MLTSYNICRVVFIKFANLKLNEQTNICIIQGFCTETT